MARQGGLSSTKLVVPGFHSLAAKKVGDFNRTSPQGIISSFISPFIVHSNLRLPSFL
jgi:hypothetical protein